MSDGSNEPAMLALQLTAEQTATVAPLIQRARKSVGPTGERRCSAPSVVFGELDFPFFDHLQPGKDLSRAEFRCGMVSAKAARKIRKHLDDDRATAPLAEGSPIHPAPVAVSTPRVVAIDFETYYDADYDVGSLGYRAYVHHQKFDAYLVAFWADDGWHWAGHPKDAPWDKVTGATWLSHNAQFDRAVFFRLRETGVIPMAIAPGEWLCTAALAVYLAAPRNLAGAARELAGLHLDKNIRERASGRHGPELFDDSEEIRAYALKDAEACFVLWREHHRKWPEHERRLATQTIEMGERGIQIDVDYVTKSIGLLEQALAVATSQIPWARNAKPTSPNELNKACRVAGIEPPASTAEDSPEFEAWHARYGDRFQWVAAMQAYRRANRKLKILQAALTRCNASGEPS